MSTTTLFVEILIIGFQAMVCLATLLVAFGWQSPWTWQQVKDGLPVLTLGLLALAYILGILVDRAADSAYGSVAQWLRRNKIMPPKDPLPASMGLMRLWIMKESDGIAKFIDYQRSRVRIVRATVFNLLAETAIATVYVARCGTASAALGVLAGGLIVVILVFLAAERITRAYEDRVSEAYTMLHTIIVEIAAAVCFRRTGKDVSLLLVRTKGGKYWTFPKGHIKKKERDRHWIAAEREAAEEAGVIGTVRRLPFAYYRYKPKESTGDKHVSYRVEAYLMEVTGTHGRPEANREPTWFPPAEAMAKLAEGPREEIYAEEHRLVVEAALDAIGLGTHR